MMKKSNSKKMIMLILIILLLLCLAILLYLLNIMTKEESNTINNEISNNNTVEEEPSVLYTDTSIHKTESIALLLSTQDCINKYYDYVYNKNSDAVISILDDEYIQEKNINKDNLFNNIKNINEKTQFFAIDVYEKEISFDHEYRFYIYGKSYGNNYKSTGEEIFVVNLDVYNYTFSIYSCGNANENEYKNVINQLIAKDNGGNVPATSEATSISSNNYNSFEVKKYNELTKSVIENYIGYYYFLEINDKDKAYNLLDENYKTARFNSLNEYYNYINQNNEYNLNLSYITKYTNENENRYVGIDDKGKYYIIIETAPMEYKVMLDSYTLPLTETKEKYDSSSEVEKACMCLEVVKEMINTNDYNAIYNHLNETFKNNNFNSVHEFSKFINSKYFKNNQFSYKTSTLSGDSYIINVEVTDTDNLENKFEINYVVKLGKGLEDFELSFNIN